MLVYYELLKLNPAHEVSLGPLGQVEPPLVEAPWESASQQMCVLFTNIYIYILPSGNQTWCAGKWTICNFPIRTSISSRFPSAVVIRWSWYIYIYVFIGVIITRGMIMIFLILTWCDQQIHNSVWTKWCLPLLGPLGCTKYIHDINNPFPLTSKAANVAVSAGRGSWVVITVGPEVSWKSICKNHGPIHWPYWHQP